MEILYVDLYFQDDKVTVLSWGVKNIGFGLLVYDNDTYDILDDECMGEEFCKEIIDYYLK